MEQPSLHNCGWLIGGEAWRVWIQFWTMIGWTEAPVSNCSSIVLWLILIRSNSRISCGLATDCKRKILQTKNEKWSFYSSYGAVEIKGKEAEVQPNIHWPFRCFFSLHPEKNIWVFRWRTSSQVSSQFAPAGFFVSFSLAKWTSLRVSGNSL